MNLSLSGRIAVVTGASRAKGIGTAICRMLAAQGADIFFTYYSPYDATMPWGANQEEAVQLQHELEQMGVRCGRLELDLSQPDAYVQVLDAVERQLGKPSILVNNACHSVNHDYDQMDATLLDAHYAINLRATALLSVEFARRFELGRGGRIINLTSGQSQGPMLGELAYVATKAAVEGMTMSLAAEVAPKGITVNAVNPGPTDTGWMTEELKQELLPRFPFGRVGEPRDMARLIAFLASEEAEWITGQVIHSEGGFMRG
ncbi:SDR family oxidoreductase [Brevibacillus sp. CHY01]|uniref:SDR family oxidoreductase n=1 Tax=Brevibacillus dissolubilis TaxID=1844116 RepID=UPI0011160F00